MKMMNGGIARIAHPFKITVPTVNEPIIKSNMANAIEGTCDNMSCAAPVIRIPDCRDSVIIFWNHMFIE